MQQCKHRVDIVIETKEGEEMCAHSLILTAQFPALQRLVGESPKIRLNWSRFPLEVVEAAVDYAYTGQINLSSQIAIGVYLLAHNLRNRTLVEWCTEFLCSSVNFANVCEIWSAANATKNELLMASSGPQVALNWEICSARKSFQMTTEVTGMKSLFSCNQMAPVSVKSKLIALSAWINSVRDAEVRTARIEAFRDLIPSLQIEQTPDIFADLCDANEEMKLPRECRGWLVQSWRDAKEKRRTEEPVASSSFDFSSSMRQIDFITGYREGLATVHRENADTFVRILKPKSTETEKELKLIGRSCFSIISFQSKLVFIGGRENGVLSKRVDLMDPSTESVSPLPEISFARLWPLCAVNDSQIFVFGDQFPFSPASLSCELYESGSKSWLPLPSMIVERSDYAVVHIPDRGVLALGGTERNTRRRLKETELLTCVSGAGHSKWTWRPISPMLKECGTPKAVRFQQWVYVVDEGRHVSEMEVLNLSAGADNCQWTILASFGSFESSLKVGEMTKVYNRLLIRAYNSEYIYVVEIEMDPKFQHRKFGQMKRVPSLKIGGQLITVRIQIS